MKKVWVGLLRGISAGLILAAAALAAWQYQQFSQAEVVFPRGSRIAQVAVGGLRQDQALERLLQAYGLPVELRYAGALIQARPEALGFELEVSRMLAEAELARLARPFWDAFWDYLTEREPAPIEIPLEAAVREDAIRAYLKTEIAARYDSAATRAMPLAGTTRTVAGKGGNALEVEPAVPLISAALRSLTQRSVTLTARATPALGPLAQNLQTQLKQLMALSHFDGISELYLQDLQSGETVQAAAYQGRAIPGEVGFTAASTIKIAIMASTFRRVKEPAPQAVLDNLAKMIEFSENDPADALMQQVMSKNNGPLEVTSDLQALGFKNTFLAGYFYPGAALLKRFTTPANQRKDYFTDPDPYNQTTPAEMGQLLTDIARCAADGGGDFARVFNGEITQGECQQMVEFLVLNKLPVLITVGLPEGTRIGHKHGWITELDGVVHSFSDAAIVYTPGGSYVLTIYLWSKNQLLFDTANPLFATLSQAVYGYFNPERP